MNGLSVVLSFVGPKREVLDPYQIDFTSQGLLISQNSKGAVLLPGETKTLDYGIRKLIHRHRFDTNALIRYAVFDVVVFDERKSR